MSTTPEVVYCDDFEAITGQKVSIETKVIAAPEIAEVAPSTTAEVA
jgi:hypothetical protein